MKNLTEQETRIAHFIANGYIAKEIADRLYISALTVNTHMRNIRMKLRAKNIADITRVYILSLPNASDVLKAVLFLAIQIGVIVNNPDIDMRRGRRVETKVQTTRTLRKAKD